MTAGPLWAGHALGAPAPQGSKSVDRRGRMYEQNRRTRPWRREMVEAFIVGNAYYGRTEPIDEPVTVRATFYLPRPKRPRFNVPGVKPDTDKLQRNLGDAMQEAGVLSDDSRIVEWHVRKAYATTGEPGVWVEIHRHDPEEWTP